MDKAERLAQIMFEEDEYREANKMELMYHTKEDFEAEKRKEKKKRNKPKGLFYLNIFFVRITYGKQFDK